MSLRPLSVEAFVSAPVGGYVAGRTFLAWCASPTLCGGVSWGRSTRDDLDVMLTLHDSVLQGRGLASRVDVLLDLRGIESVGADLFTRYLSTVGPRVPAFADAIRRQALLVPEGLLGGLMAGFYPLVTGRKPTHRIFHEPAEANAWLGIADDVVAAIATVAAPMTQSRLLVSRVRSALTERLADPSIADVAHALGTTPRSLQRRLAQQGTSFRDQVAWVRLNEATLRLERGEKQAAVARHLGLHPSTLSELLASRPELAAAGARADGTQVARTASS